MSWKIQAAIWVLSLVAVVPCQVFAGEFDADYQVSTIAYNLRDVSATGTEVILGDDEVSGAIPVGFAFEYFGDFYGVVYISSNGFITFDSGTSSGCCSGVEIPTPGGINNLVAGFWEDLNPTNGGTIRYQTVGVPPNREFIVGFYQVEHFRGNTPVEMEMILHEGSSVVELQYTTATTAGESNHSVGVESASGMFGTQVDFGTGFSYTTEGRLLTPAEGGGDEQPVARFRVDKEFNDLNPAEVEVSITCNTGLPLQQSTSIAQGDGVTFVVTDFADGELDCEISENPVPVGYLALYSEDGGLNFSVTTACNYQGVAFGQSDYCVIRNELQRVLVSVTKAWIDENPQFDAQNYAEASYDCINEQFGVQAFGSLEFVGDGAVDGFYLFPHFDGATECTVTETVLEGGVEADDSDCQALQVTPGAGAECTIVNTRLYEGIPSLSRAGLGLLALLMMGVGFVAVRRLA